MTKKTLLFLSILMTLGLMLALVGCAPKTVIRDGIEIPVTEASKDDFAAIEQLLEQGQTEQAVSSLASFIKDYPDSELLDDALVLLGRLQMEQEQYEAAAISFQQIVSDMPQSSHYLQAAVQLGLALAKLGRTEEALPMLQSIFDRLPDQNRQAEVAAMLADAYYRARTPVEAIRWFTVLYRLRTDDDSRTSIRIQMMDLIDRQLSFVQTREALELLKQLGETGFPVDLLQFKLAKIFFHIFDFETSRTLLEQFVATWPQHEKTAEAGILLKKIIDRNKVNPTAIGVLLPLTGKYRGYGQQALAGLQLGAGIFEEPKPGVEGPVLIIRDTAGDPEKAAAHMEDLVYNEHVIGVIGPIFSGESVAGAIKAQELEVPLLALSGKEDLPQIGKFVFRNFLTLKSQAKMLVNYAMKELGVTKFALLYPNDKYGVGFVNAFWNEVKKNEGEIRAAERYEPDIKNFSVPIKKLVGRYWLEARKDYIEERDRIKEELKDQPLAKKRAMEKLLKRLRPEVDFQAIFVPEYAEKVAMIAPALAFEDIVLKTSSNWKIDRMKKSLGREELDMVYILGGNGWNNQKVVEWAQRYVQGAIFCDSFFAPSSRLATRRFVAKFKSQFEQEPGWLEAQAYDSARIIRNIIEKKQTYQSS